ncbi:MAG: hypothetical protein ACI9BW_003280 [Gammaproteobacteria bacterium]|jgi:hypothetical protein
MSLSRQHIAVFVFLIVSALAFSSQATENGMQDWVELPLAVPKATRDNVYALPPIKMPADFQYSVLVAPGSPLYDPFDIYVVDENTLWVADDAGGGTIYAVTMDGDVSVRAASGQHPPISLDVAPASFGKHAGYIYTVAFSVPEKIGGWELPNAVTRFNPTTFAEEVVCFLPSNAAGAAGAGSFFARFGPVGSPFAGKLYITAASNHTIYTVTPEDECTPLATIDLQRWGSPRGISFTPDGKTMLIGAAIQDPKNPAITRPGRGSILRVSPTGAVAEKPFVSGLHEPGAMAFAPSGFGEFAGDLFISDAGNWDNDIAATSPIASDGKLYRVSQSGDLQPFASGLANPVAVTFVGDQLVLTDINGDFHVGQHKIPIGFIITIRPAVVP